MSSKERQQVVRILSSSDFEVEVEGNHPVKFKTTRPSMDSNDYSLTVMADSDAHEDFSTNLIILHPFTKQRQVLPVHFSHSKQKPAQEDYYV